MSANSVPIHEISKKYVLCALLSLCVRIDVSEAKLCLWQPFGGQPGAITAVLFHKKGQPPCPIRAFPDESQKDLVEQAVQLPHIEGGQKPPG